MQVFEKRVITTTNPGGGPGSNIIGTDLLGGEFIDILRAQVVVQRMGARVLSGLVGNTDIPKLKASASAGWFAENSAITPSDHQFSKVSLTPKHVGAITEFSRNMLLQSTPDIEQLVRADFASILAQAVDRAAIQGGATNEPDGVLVTAGVHAVDMTGGVSWERILEFIEKVENSNAVGTGWITSPSVVRLLRSTLRDSNTAAVFIMDGPDQLAGYPCARTTLATDDGSPTIEPLIFGAWSDLLIGMWSALDILVNPFESTA